MEYYEVKNEVNEDLVVGVGLEGVVIYDSNMIEFLRQDKDIFFWGGGINLMIVF